jgi:hypothetical protein
MRFLLALVAFAGLLPAQAQLDFFEKRVRPVLASRCYACHSAKTLASGGLLLDTRQAARRGGNRGPAVVAGQADLSLLLRAIRYTDPVVRMPPSGKLPDQEIADLEAWIRMGAPDPREEAPAAPAAPSEEATLVESRKWWAFQPFRAHPAPRVGDPQWGSNFIDRFLLAGLENKRLRPAPRADKLTLIRRLSFNLTGLPPAPEEIDRYLADTSPKAYEKLVDRLLASPHYGERWARHWLDLARFAETDGHEFDREKPNAWAYRDYVIRAFNSDLPFDQFIREQIAGDIIEPQRRLAGDLRWESITGTAFFALGEERNAADDLGEVRAEKRDNQVDTLTKTFLGLTVSCARCHDHKFDPISTRDYYALAGVLDGKQVIQACLDTPERMNEFARIQEEIGQRNRRLAAIYTARLGQIIEKLPAYLRLAAGWATRESDPADVEIKKAAEQEKLEPALLKAWAGDLRIAAREPDHVFYPLARLARTEERPFPERLEAMRTELSEWNHKADPNHPIHKERKDLVIADFTRGERAGWRVDGPAFAGVASAFVSPQQVLSGHRGLPLVNSFTAAGNEGMGFLTSKTFLANRRFMHVRLAGNSDSTSGRQPGLLRVSLVGDGRDTIFTPDGSGRLQWRTSGLGKMFNELAFIEIADRTKSGHIVVDRIVLSDSREPPLAGRFVNGRLLRMLERSGAGTLDALIAEYAALLGASFQDEQPDAGARWLRESLLPAFALEQAPLDLSAAEKEEAERLIGERREIAQRLPEPLFALASVEDQPRNLRVHIAGNHLNLGEEVPRGFLKILSTGPDEGFRQGSGRRELAEAIASPRNPLTARVIVNRVWKHHFGEGLVRTPDNFGRTGQAPAHPELLDTLASWFVDNGWSLKRLHRLILLSSAYRMSNRPEPRAALTDPDNRLLHHMPVRRLEGEAIRDAMLAVSGSLDRTLFGPSVMPHVSEYQDGRGKPVSGPLDGNGRRSIYIGVRRNFLPPLFVAFDYPMTVTTIGKRGVSTVPSQALMLMNNEFVVKEAAKWADRAQASAPDPRARINGMFRSAFGRGAEPAEIDKSFAFIAAQRTRYGEAKDAEFRAWADLAHALFNSKEFIFVR